jgi:hypothetical protein
MALPGAGGSGVGGSGVLISTVRMKFKNRRFAPTPAFIGLSAAALVAWGISHWTGFSFWGAFAVIIVSMFINGVIAEHEDNAPGGFNNPHPSSESKQPDDIKRGH